MNKLNGAAFIVILSIFSMLSCSLKILKLPDGRTKVPAKNDVYKIRQGLSSVVFEQVDTNGLYWRADKREDAVVSIYRFYGDGSLNLFVFRVEETTDLVTRLDPTFSGYRGVYYSVQSAIKGALFAPINGLGDIGKLEKNYTFRGDTMFEASRQSQYRNVYIKKQIPQIVAAYRPVW